MKFINKLNISNIQWDIVLLITLCPLYNAFWGAYGVFQIIFVPIILLFLYYALSERNKAPIKNYVKIYLVICIQWAILTMFVGMDVLQYSKVFVLALLVMIHPVSNKTQTIIYPLLVIVGIVVGYEMIQQQDMVADVRLSLQIGETLQDPNWISIFLFAPFCYGLKMLVDDSSLMKIAGAGLAITIIGFSVYVVFLTGSRGALLGMVAATLVWIRITFKRSRIGDIIIVIAAALLFFNIFTTYLLPNADSDLIARYVGGDIGEDRTVIWSKLIPEYLNGNVAEVLLGRGPRSCVRDIGMSAHNMFLEQLFQTGIVGLFLMLAFLVQIFKDTIKCKNHIGLLITTSLFTLSLTTPIWGHIYFMIPLGMVVYVNNAMNLREKRITNKKLCMSLH